MQRETDLPTIPDWRSHALFLDFDGTLVPIENRPEEVRLSTETRALLKRLSKAVDGAIAVLSGRALHDLSAHLDGLGLTLSGSHGLELRLPGGPITLDDAARPDLLNAAFDTLFPLAHDAGLLLERKPGAVALHYRNHPEAEGRCREAVTRVASVRGLRAVHGDMVSEAALSGIDKGRALARLMGKTPFLGRVPIMVGDDTTDEDGFAAAQAREGFGIRIGGSETVARYRVAQRTTVMDWLADTLDADDT